MSRNHMILAVLVAVLAAASAAAVIAIELGLAFQSQSDSTDDVPVGDYVKARNSEDKMVSIPSVVYAQSQDKESFVLTNTSQSIIGMMEVGTKDNANKGLTTLITFQEAGTWMFVETMDLTIQREISFAVIVNKLTSLTGTTVITIDEDGEVGTARNDTAVEGSWKVWGVGPVREDYNPSAPGNVNDPHNGFLVLVDQNYIMTHHYNVMVVSGTDDITVSMKTPKSIGDSVVSTGEWRSWNSLALSSGYSLKSSDLYRCTDAASKVSIYDSTVTDGVAGRQTDPVTVCTGYYHFAIDIHYKSQIKINPTNYQGENMKSNVVFFLSDTQTYHVTYNIANGAATPATSVVMYHAAFSTVITPSEHYNRAASVSITMSGKTFTQFSYNPETGELAIAADKIEGALVITAVNTPVPYTVTLVLGEGTLAHTPTGWTESTYTREFGYGTPYQEIIASIVYSGEPIEPVATQAHRAFKGWSPNTGTLGAADANLTAQYDDTFAVNFANGSHGTVSAKIKGGAAISSGDEVLNGTKVVFTYTPTTAGYYAEGWTDNTMEATVSSSSYELSFTEDNRYAVTFANGSHGTVAAEIKNGLPISTGNYVAYGTVIVFTYTPTTEGYHAMGWTDNTLEVTISSTYVLSFTEGNLYTATFDLDGGTVASTPEGWALFAGVYVKDFDYGTTKATIISNFGDYSKEGYTKGTETASVDTMGTSGMTITANWNINQYTATFDLDGGTVASTPEGWTLSDGTYTKDFDYGTTKAAIISNFGAYTKDGYTKGAETASVDTMGISGMTITANWDVNQYTATFDLNGGAVASTPSGWTLSAGVYTKDFDYGTAKATIISDFGAYSKEGYTKGAETASADTMGTSGMTITANWAENQVTVTFNGNGSTSGSMAAQVVKYSDETKTLNANAFVKTGSTFVEWNTADDGTGTDYAAGASVAALITSPTETLTLYAQWEADPEP